MQLHWICSNCAATTRYGWTPHTDTLQRGCCCHCHWDNWWYFPHYTRFCAWIFHFAQHLSKDFYSLSPPTYPHPQLSLCCPYNMAPLNYILTVQRDRCSGATCQGSDAAQSMSVRDLTLNSLRAIIIHFDHLEVWSWCGWWWPRAREPPIVGN